MNRFTSFEEAVSDYVTKAKADALIDFNKEEKVFFRGPLTPEQERIFMRGIDFGVAIANHVLSNKFKP